MAQARGIRVKREKVRVHNPLGDSIDLARHLILGVRLVAA
jgi:hypothetical protein